MQIHLKEKTWNWHAHTITLLDPWSSDLTFRLDVQTWVQTWESSIQDWRLKILQGSSWRICNPGLKIEDSPGLLLGNLQSRREPLMLNPQSWIEDSPRRVPGNLQSSIFSPGLKISQQESWRIFNLQSSILDWRSPNFKNMFKLCQRPASLARSLQSVTSVTFSPSFVALGSKHRHHPVAHHRAQDAHPCWRTCDLAEQPGRGGAGCGRQQPGWRETSLRLTSAPRQSYAAGSPDSPNRAAPPAQALGRHGLQCAERAQVGARGPAWRLERS